MLTRARVPDRSILGLILGLGVKSDEYVSIHNTASACRGTEHHVAVHAASSIDVHGRCVHTGSKARVW